MEQRAFMFGIDQTYRGANEEKVIERRVCHVPPAASTISVLHFNASMALS